MKTSDIISFIALASSFIVPFYLLSYEKHSDEIMPRSDRSVQPGFIDTIYFSKFNKDHDIVLDLCNRNKNALSNPELEVISDSLKEVIINNAIEEALVKKSVLYILNDQKQITDSVKVRCFDCSTIGITVPANGYLVFKCVSGCLNNFCSYEFVSL